MVAVLNETREHFCWWNCSSALWVNRYLQFTILHVPVDFVHLKGVSLADNWAPFVIVVWKWLRHASLLRVALHSLSPFFKLFPELLLLVLDCFTYFWLDLFELFVFDLNEVFHHFVRLNIAQSLCQLLMLFFMLKLFELFKLSLSLIFILFFLLGLLDVFWLELLL